MSILVIMIYLILKNHYIFRILIPESVQDMPFCKSYNIWTRISYIDVSFVAPEIIYQL